MEYCQGRSLDPLEATSPVIADPLLDLFNKGRSPSTLVGYRSAIEGALKLHQGVDYGTDPQLSSLLTSVTTERPEVALRVPQWI